MNFSETCRYCTFQKNCECIERDEVENCLFWREENPYNNGEE